MEYSTFDEFAQDLKNGIVGIICYKGMEDQLDCLPLCNNHGMTLAQYVSVELGNDFKKSQPLTLDGGWWIRKNHNAIRAVTLKCVLDLFNKDNTEELKAILSF